MKNQFLKVGVVVWISLLLVAGCNTAFRKKQVKEHKLTISQVKSDFREMINETEEEIKSEFKSPPPETKDQDNLS